VIWILGGVMLCLFLVFIPYQLYQRYAYVIYAAMNALLVMVLFIGKSAGGSQRWIPIGPLHVQPSEMAKIGLVLCLAKFFHDHHGRKEMRLGDLIVPILLSIVPFLLILRQPDLGTGLILLGTASMMIWFIGIERKIVASVIILGLLSVPVAWKFVLKPYQKDRVISFVQPEKYANTKGYQIIQSKIAIGSGKTFGKGYLKGTQSKLQYLPKQHTDFVFSNYAEEFGFIGSLILLALYLLFGMMGLNIAITSKEVFSVMAAYGLTAMIMIQTMINLGMELGLLPVVGMTLPFFSYGGTSMLTSFICVGMLMNISMNRIIHASKSI
jgi:rod shape determining protein RodA